MFVSTKIKFAHIWPFFREIYRDESSTFSYCERLRFFYSIKTNEQESIRAPCIPLFNWFILLVQMFTKWRRNIAENIPKTNSSLFIPFMCAPPKNKRSRINKTFLFKCFSSFNCSAVHSHCWVLNQNTCIQ